MREQGLPEEGAKIVRDGNLASRTLKGENLEEQGEEEGNSCLSVSMFHIRSHYTKLNGICYWRAYA
jgi:hypothetical protein